MFNNNNNKMNVLQAQNLQYTYTLLLQIKLQIFNQQGCEACIDFIYSKQKDSVDKINSCIDFIFELLDTKQSFKYWQYQFNRPIEMVEKVFWSTKNRFDTVSSRLYTTTNWLENFSFEPDYSWYT